jgi:hypothetical protein
LAHAEGLDLNLKLLRDSRKFHQTLLNDLEILRRIGNPAAHGADLSDGECQKSFEASERIVEFLAKTIN